MEASSLTSPNSKVQREKQMPKEVSSVTCIKNSFITWPVRFGLCPSSWSTDRNALIRFPPFCFQASHFSETHSSWNNSITPTPSSPWLQTLMTELLLSVVLRGTKDHGTLWTWCPLWDLQKLFFFTTSARSNSIRIYQKRSDPTRPTYP